MKKVLLGMAAALLVSGSALAADVVLKVAPAHRTFIKEYVVKQRVAPITASQTFVVGTAVPTTVAVTPVPEAIYTTAPEVRDYDYFYWNGRVVFVDRNTRAVVDVIE